MPGPSNTGAPEGRTLRVHEGDLTVSTDGAVIDGLDIHGFLRIEADDVVVRNSVVRGRDPRNRNESLVAAYGDHRNFLIEDSTLVTDDPSGYVDGLKGHHFTARRLDVSRVVDSAVVFGDDVSIEDSWFHDNSYFSPWAGQPDGQTHNDSVQIEGGRSVRLVGNVFEEAHNAAVMITQNHSATREVEIVGNLLSGGGCTVNIDEKGRGPIDITMRDNTFGPSRLGCPVIGPASSAPRMEDNVSADTSQQVVARRNG